MSLVLYLDTIFPSVEQLDPSDVGENGVIFIIQDVVRNHWWKIRPLDEGEKWPKNS